MNTSFKRNFITYISFKLSRKGRSITKRLFKLQISEDSAVVTPLAPRTPLYELFCKRANRKRTRVSKLKSKLIALKRRYKQNETPFRVLKPGDLNRLFAESDSTSKVKPRKLFSKTPKIKSLFLKLKSRKSGTNNKLNEIVPYNPNVEKPSKRKHNKLKKYLSRMKAKWSLRFQKLRSPIVTFDESLYDEYKEVIKFLELFQGHMLPQLYIPFSFTEPLIEFFVEEYNDEVSELPEVCEGDDDTVDHLEIVEIDETPIEVIDVSEIEQGDGLDVLFEGNLDLKLQFFHEEELAETFTSDASPESILTARFGLFDPESPHELQKPQGEEPLENEPLCQPQYLQEDFIPQPQSLDELFETIIIEDYPQEERLDQQEPLAAQPAEEHTEESEELQLRLEELQLEGTQLTKEKDDSQLNHTKLRDGEMSILSELVDLVSTDESVSRPLQEDDESSCSTMTFRKEDWSWYYEQQETPNQSQDLQDQLLDDSVDDPHLQDELLDDSVDEPHLKEDPKEPETLEDDNDDDDDSGTHLPLNIVKLHETMGVLDQYALRRDHAQTTRASIDIMNSRDGSCSWYYISTTYEHRYNSTHLQRTGHLGVLPAKKTVLEKDYVDGLLKDIMFKTLIVNTMLSNSRTDLLTLSQASFITSSPALKCHLSPLGLEELLYKIGYDWDMVKSRFHELLDLVSQANEIVSLADYIPDDIYNYITRINNFMVKVRGKYDTVMETMRVTKTCVLFDLNNECRASRGEIAEQGRGVTRGCNHQGPLGINSYHRKAHQSMFEHFCHVNSMLTALQRTVALRKRARTRSNSAPKKQ